MQQVHSRLAVGLLAVLASSGARASGFYFGDNGAKAMLQGGAFTAQADDLSAIQHNPAGLAQLPGVSLMADLNLISHQVSFLRQDNGFDPAAPSTLPATVDNSKSGIFLSPFLGGSFGFQVAGRTMTVSLGVYGPPAPGRYTFPSPNYTKEEDANNMKRYVESPKKFTPQRYSLIANDILILYPSLSVAYAIHPRFMVGISAQLVVSHFSISQAISGDPTNPQTLLGENPEFDATVDVNVSGNVGFTGVLGVLAKPTDWLALGASLRPPVPIKAVGSIRMGLTSELQGLGVRVEDSAGASCTAVPEPGATAPCDASLEMTLPLELRFGARWTPFDRLGINADFVYQGWNSVDQFLLTPLDVNLIQGGNATPIEPFAIPKKWVGTFSGRLGASVNLIKFLTVHAGFLFETAASPLEQYAVDFAHPTRVMITGGLTGHFGPLDVMAGIAWAPTVRSTPGAIGSAQSEVRRGTTDSTTPGGVVGAGIYDSGGFTIVLGVRARFPPKPKPEVHPTPEPAPAPAPAPAAPPAEQPAPTTPAPTPAPTEAVPGATTP